MKRRIDEAGQGKAAAAYHQIRHDIRTGELASGQRVTLAQLSGELGMSLTPVREALNRLEAEGFVIHERHRGTSIAELTTERITQIYRLRLVLEPMAVSLAGQALSEADLEELRVLLRVCDQARSPQEIVEANERFHRALYRLSGDPLLVGFIDKLWAGVPYQSLSLYDRGPRVQASSREHHEVLDALAEGRAEDAAEAMRAHISNGRLAVLGAL